MQGVNLSASTYWVPGTDSMQYLNYGAATSEVTVSTLHTQLVISWLATYNLWFYCR